MSYLFSGYGMSWTAYRYIIRLLDRYVAASQQRCHFVNIFFIIKCHDFLGTAEMEGHERILSLWEYIRLARNRSQDFYNPLYFPANPRSQAVSFTVGCRLTFRFGSHIQENCTNLSRENCICQATGSQTIWC